MSSANTKNIKIEPNVDTDTGITERGLYRWNFVGEPDALYFIWNNSNGILLNTTWFSSNIEIKASDGKMIIKNSASGNNQATISIKLVG